MNIMEEITGIYLPIMEISLAYSLRLYTEQFCAVLKITESFRSKLMYCM